MSGGDPAVLVPDADIKLARRRARLLLLLDAAERAGITPIAAARLHAFAYLADVLSPVWNLVPFDGTIYKSDGGPHYPELQLELDRMVALGLVDISQFKFVDRGEFGARIDGFYALNFTSERLPVLLAALGAEGSSAALDPSDVDVHEFLVELAGALATIPDDQIDVAAGVDVTYGAAKNLNNVIDFADWVQDKWQANATWRAAERFRAFLPSEATLSPGEKLYLYATYLGRSLNAA